MGTRRAFLLTTHPNSPTLSPMRQILLILTLLFAPLTRAADTITQLPAMVVSATGEIRTPAVLGDSATFLDTPRAYAQVGPQAMEDYSVTKIGQLSSFDASVQGTGQYGHVATVNVRGDMAELYQNGQRRTNNAAGFQPSFNGVEQVDVVKGAAPVVFGPGFYSGGYLNLQTKNATQARGTSVALTMGDLSADHSYLNTTASVDSNLPLTERDAVRVSYEGRRNQTFYRAGRDDEQDLYLTFHRSLPGASLDLYLQHDWQATPQIEGINGVTQDLIDHRTYLGHLLKPTDNLVSPGDFSNANVTTAQAIYERDRVFKSYTLVEVVDRRRFNAFSYTEYAKQLTLDQRAEWHWDTDFAYTIAGVNGRFEKRESYTNYFNAQFAAYDISKPGVRDASLLPTYIAGTPGPGGRLFFGPLDGNTDTTLSSLYQTAAFLQQRFYVARGWQLLYGLRVDGYRVFVTDPLTYSISDDASVFSFSRTASLIHTMGEWSVYATYGHLYSVNGTVSGGGIVFAPDNRINKANLHSLNQLYEIGARRETSVGEASLTAFWQARQQPDLYAYAPNDIVVRGVELELNHRSGSWGVVNSVTYNEANFRHSAPFELPSQYLVTVTEPGDYRVPGISRVYATSVFSYQGKRWGGALLPRWQSEQAGNALGGYHIPSQYTLDAQASYRRAKWSVALNVHNVTNRWNWVHNSDSFGDSVVVHHAPLLNANLTVRYTR